MKKDDVSNKRRIIIFLIIVLIIIIVSFVIVIKLNKKINVTDNNVEINSIEDNVDKISDDVAKNSIDKNNKENVIIKNGEKVNTSNKLSQDKEFDGLKFTNVKLRSINGSTNFTANVKNISGKEYKSKSLKVKFMNSNGSEMGSLTIYIPDLSIDGETTVDSSITEDYVNAYDIKIIS